jgi:hypothetical protein
VRKNGQNQFDPEEKEKYYSDDFLHNVRHINERVEVELEEFKVEIANKMAESSTKNFCFPRPGGNKILINKEQNEISVENRAVLFKWIREQDKLLTSPKSGRKK